MPRIQFGAVRRMGAVALRLAVYLLDIDAHRGARAISPAATSETSNAIPLHPLATACPGGGNCSGRGTCNLLTGKCSCLFGWDGDACEADALRACRLPGHLHENWDAHRAASRLHYLFSSTNKFERAELSDPWQVFSIVDKTLVRFGSYHWHGPRACSCLRELFNYVQFRVSHPRGMVYICMDAPLHAYLQQPSAPEFQTLFKYIDADTLDEIPYTPRHFDNGTKRRIDWDAPAPAEVPPQAAALLPLSSCPDGCGDMGYCTSSAGSPTCECYKDFAQPRDGTCVAREFEWKLCANSCQKQGTCVMGLCICHRGFFGVDCALTLDPDNTTHAVAYNSVAASPVSAHVPLFYIVDTPARYSLAYTAGRRMEKFATRSRYRAGDPAAAAYQLIMSMAGPPMLGLLKWLERSDPAFSRAAAANFSSFIVTGPGDHGISTGWFPDQGWDGTEAEWAAYGPLLHPNSPDRVLTFTQFLNRIDGVQVGRTSCWSCFQRGKDVAVPLHPWDMDGAGCTRFAGSVPVSSYKKLSPWGKAEADRWPPRKYLFFFATGADSRKWPVTGRPQLLPFVNESDFLLRGNFYGEAKIRTEHGCSQSTFCWVPFGQIGGCTGRHIHAVQFGCIPVWWIPEGMDRAFPFADTLGDTWRRASVVVHERDVYRLPEILRSISKEEIHNKRTALEELWEPLMYSTYYGKEMSIWGEDGRRDAAQQLYLTLAKRHDLRFGTDLVERMTHTLPSSGVVWA